MKLHTVAACALLALSVSAVISPASAGTQQDKMKTCNADATTKGLKGPERQTFMSTCLSAKAAAPATQQDKMKSCNAEASKQALKGDQRKTYMSSCLKSH